MDINTQSGERREYRAPQVTRWGAVEDITLVGQTRPGGDVLPGNAQGNDAGSINPPGLNR